MQLIISDANILIDFEKGQLLTPFFRLPYQFKVPDILFEEELKAEHTHLLKFGLQLGVLSGEAMRNALALTQKYNAPSRNDCFALALAKQEQCPLLTGDKALRKAAEKEAVIVQGTLWVVEQLITHELISKQEAVQAYELMKQAGRRLPWSLARERLEEL